LQTQQLTLPPTAPRRTPVLGALLSFLWPGLGQVYVGRRRAAALFAVPLLLLLLAGLWLALGGVAVLAGKFLSWRFALSVAILAVLIGAWRAASMIHAFVAAGPQPRAATISGRAALAMLLGAVVAMHAVAGYYAWSFYSFDTQIAGIAGGATGSGSAGASPAPGSSGDPGAAPPIEPAETPAPGSTRVTILLSGADSGPGRDHALNDTLLLVSLDTTTRKVAMVSVPRDTSAFPLYWGGKVGSTFKINALASAVRQGRLKSPDQPMATLAKEIGYLVGIPVNYYAVIDLTGFPRMIDLVGGVDVVNPKAFFDPMQNHTWPAGPMHLDGDQALLYVRSRYGDSDYARATRQQDVLVALEKKMTNPGTLLKLPQLLDAAAKTIRTNFPMDTVSDYVALAQDLPSGAISRCVLGPPYNFHPDSSTTGGVWTSRLKLDMVASLSVALFGQESRYYGTAKPAPCGS
jgi:polyisoprenyl-teichoic acid--peptidoglycan teichoic acid transferase